jgi:HEPN domain-containing protein
MPRDDPRSADTRAWLIKADEDLRAVDAARAAVPPLIGVALFHTQQACEKALKAFLTWHDRPFPRTHDLRELGQRCMDVDQTLEDVCRRAQPLTVYAWAFRYPGEPTPAGADEAETAMRVAMEVVRAVLARVPADVHP